MASYSSDQKYKIIRPSPDYIPQIVGLMRRLAEFENLLSDFKVTSDLLEHHLFGENPIAELLIGCNNNRALGYALFYNNFSSFRGRPGIYLEDIFVDQHVRGCGLGKSLLLEVINVARERNCDRCDWLVLDWNEKAKKFYKSVGASIMPEWQLCRMDLIAIEKFLASNK